MSTELIERKTVDVTPKSAEHYLTFNTYEVQRALRPHHVEELYQKMCNGDFRYGNIAFARVPNNLSKIMVDGQHICHSIIKFNQSVPCVIEEYKCTDGAALSKLFRQFDNLTRSFADCMKVKHFESKYPWPPRITKLAIAALSSDYKLTQGMPQSALKSLPSSSGGVTTGYTKKSISFGHTLFTTDQKIDILDSHLKEVYFLVKLVTKEDGTFRKEDAIRLITISPIIVMVFRTYRISEADAFFFWNSLINGVGLTEDQSIYHLREFLNRVRWAVKSKGQKNPKVSDHEYMQRIAKAWNTYRTGNGSPKTKYYKDSIIPDLV